MTASVGLAGFKVGDDSHSIIDRADRAMYSAKAGGRNRVIVSDEFAAPTEIGSVVALRRRWITNRRPRLQVFLNPTGAAGVWGRLRPHRSWARSSRSNSNQPDELSYRGEEQFGLERLDDPAPGTVLLRLLNELRLRLGSQHEKRRKLRRVRRLHRREQLLSHGEIWHVDVAKMTTLASALAAIFSSPSLPSTASMISNPAPTSTFATC